MAKKTRRARKSGSQLRRAQQPQAGQRQEAPAPAVAAEFRSDTEHQALRGSTAAEAAVNFREEYHYVLSDLKRVGILALIMFAVLVSLAFALPALGI